MKKFQLCKTIPSLNPISFATSRFIRLAKGSFVTMNRALLPITFRPFNNSRPPFHVGHYSCANPNGIREQTNSRLFLVGIPPFLYGNNMMHYCGAVFLDKFRTYPPLLQKTLFYRVVITAFAIQQPFFLQALTVANVRRFSLRISSVVCLSRNRHNDISMLPYFTLKRQTPPTRYVPRSPTKTCQGVHVLMNGVRCTNCYGGL